LSEIEMATPNNVPENMREKYANVQVLTDAFCDIYLNSEYRELIRNMIAKLCRKRPSPLMAGRENTWAAGIVHAIGMTNFLFDRSQIPHCKAPDIYSYFGVASSTGQNKSKEIRNLLKINQFSPEWTLPSKVAENPLVWTLKVNGMIVDARYMPIEVQEMAWRKGLIPYIPGSKKT
jgi:hypothetical protein